MDEDERSECSRSCTPESLTSTGTANIDPTEYYSDDEDDLCLDEGLEQTIAGDLETLTDSGSTVNQLELQQQQAWREYVRVKEEGMKTLQTLKKKLQSSIDKTEPFVIVWQRARSLQEQAHSAAIKFERAHSENESAKETLRIAEEGIAKLEQERTKQTPPPRTDRAKSPVCQIDIAWQETLANATERVAKTSQTRLENEIEHRRLTVEFQKCQEEFKIMENRLKRTIKKSRPYYEARHRCNQRLIDIKKKIQELDNRLSEYKNVYKSTMKHLESLNYLLHESKDRRRANSVMVTSSEPNLLMPRSQTPDFPLMIQRMALTPDVRKKDVVSNISFTFNKGSTGSLPTVEASKATANVTVVCSSPEQRHEDISQLVSISLAKAMNRFIEDNDNMVDKNETSGVCQNDVEGRERGVTVDEGVSERNEVNAIKECSVSIDGGIVFEQSVDNNGKQVNKLVECTDGNGESCTSNNLEQSSLTNVRLKIEKTEVDNDQSVNNGDVTIVTHNKILTPPGINNGGLPTSKNGDATLTTSNSEVSLNEDHTPPVTPPTNRSKSSPGLLARYAITY